MHLEEDEEVEMLDSGTEFAIWRDANPELAQLSDAICSSFNAKSFALFTMDGNVTRRAVLYGSYDIDTMICMVASMLDMLQEAQAANREKQTKH